MHVIQISFNFDLYVLFQVETFASVYRKLTGRDVSFEFPEPYL